MQQNSGNAYNYYGKLISGTIGVFLSFLIQYLNENEYCLTNYFEGTGLKYYGFELCSPIVCSQEHLSPINRQIKPQIFLTLCKTLIHLFQATRIELAVKSFSQ